MDITNSLIQHINILFYVINLFILALLIYLLFSARVVQNKRTKINDYLGVMTKTINSIRYGDLSKKIEKLDDIPDAQNLAESLNRMIETLSDRERMIVEYQNELHTQNKFLEGVINSLSDGLIILDENNKILRATPKISEWFDVPEKNLIGLHLEDYITILGEKTLEKLKEDEITIKNQSHSFVASTMDLKLEDKKRRHIVIIKNVTNQKELETLKEDFVATLTHDLKVPIVAEINMIELFLNGNFGSITEKQEIALKNMKSSNKELLDLVQTVLETYKLKDGRIRLYRENIMLKRFINEIIDEMNPIAMKTKNNIKFILNHDIMVYADKMQLKRVIKNLIQNAISYGTPNSPIEISISEIPKFIIINVKDYGAGISKTDIDRIFNKYYSAAKKFRKIGTGLGLYLAKQIITAHSGDFTVESEEGKYTEFTIKLPAVINTTLQYGE